MNQSLLVHGVAGVAVIVLAVALWQVLAASRQRAVMVAAAIGAGLASLVQLLFVFRIEHHIEHGIGVRQTDLLFDNLNHVLAAKLVLLAIAVAAASLLTIPRTKVLAYAFVAVLAVAAVATLTRVPNAQALLSLTRR